MNIVYILTKTILLLSAILCNLIFIAPIVLVGGFNFNPILLVVYVVWWAWIALAVGLANATVEVDC